MVGQNIKTIDYTTVSKSNLLENLKRNRDQHKDEYVKAVTNYNKELAEKLKTLASSISEYDIESGNPFKYKIDLAEPISRIQEYDSIIHRLENSLDDEIVLDENQYKKYMRDEWEWTNLFKTVNARYIHS